jgi:ubiquinone/menaquinone biosynthesis C-methylase UbiE
VAEQNDPEVVRREYSDEKGLAGRQSLWARRRGGQPLDVAFDEVVALRPRRVLEVGCGQGKFAERLVAHGLDVVAVDQSERMVELARERGVDARVGDLQELPFGADDFDVAVANFVLYHVPDLQRGLAELARVSPRLVATTNGERHLAEMWAAVDRDLWSRTYLFFRENGEAYLREHYEDVRMVDVPGTISMTAEDMRHYIAHSVAHKHLADRVPSFAGPTTVTASSCVFVAAR